MIVLNAQASTLILQRQYLRFITAIIIVVLGAVPLVAQQGEPIDSLHLKLSTKSGQSSANDTLIDTKINGRVVTLLIDGNDTIIVSKLSNVNISSPRQFESSADYRRYIKYKTYAAKVYPYAKQAIRIFKEVEMATETMKKRKRKKHIKKLAKQLESEFERPLKKLSKTQGKILVKMIERELDKPMFELIKMTRGKFKAFYWNQSSKLYGYRLKDQYQEGQNPILDIVLQDFDISYDIAKN